MLQHCTRRYEGTDLETALKYRLNRYDRHVRVGLFLIIETYLVGAATPEDLLDQGGHELSSSHEGRLLPSRLVN
jgi:hypothetical protein